MKEIILLILMVVLPCVSFAWTLQFGYSINTTSWTIPNPTNSFNVGDTVYFLFKYGEAFGTTSLGVYIYYSADGNSWSTELTQNMDADPSASCFADTIIPDKTGYFKLTILMNGVYYSKAFAVQ